MLLSLGLSFPIWEMKEVITSLYRVVERIKGVSMCKEQCLACGGVMESEIVAMMMMTEETLPPFLM